MSESDPHHPVAAVWYDGISSRRQLIDLFAVADGEFFEVRGRNGDLIRALPRSRIRASARLAGVARRLTMDDGSVVELRDDAWADHWFTSQNPLQAKVERLERRLATTVLIGVAGMVALFVIWQTALPWLVKRVVDRIPWNAEQALGAQVLPLLDQLGLAPSTLSAERQHHLRTLFAPLCGALPSGPSCTLEFRQGPANAMALPGGTVVVTDALVELLQNDAQFVAVAGHELGHVRERHVLQAIVRSAALGMVFTAAFSDVTLIALGGGTAVLDSLRASHSRSSERQADAYAYRTLQTAGFSPAVFADVLEQLSRTASTGGHDSWLDSHPADAERIARARDAAVMTHPPP